ncbi:MAG: DNA primase [Acidaminobacteraceae bacterium]
MAGYYDNNISEIILDRVDIVDLISNYVTLKQTGRNHKGLCPFHNEKTASFIVSDDKQLYHCFGCGAAGNAIGFYMHIENLDFLDAIEMLSEKNNIDISQYRNNKTHKKPIENKNEVYAVTRNAAVHYYKNLKTSSIANEYLSGRGLSDEIIKEFGLGYAKDSWDGLIKSFDNTNIKLLEDAGLVLPKKDKNGYYDRFRNRLIFPIINVQGKVIGFGGRVLDDSLPKYLNSPETAIFNKSMTLYGLNIAKNHIQNSRQIVVVEGYMDVISLNMHGVRNVVATLGTALTKQHGNLLSRYADEVIVCYDGDEAGQNAAVRSIDVLADMKAKVKILTLKDGLDPDDYIRKYGKDKFYEQVEKAKPSIEYKLSVFKSKYNIKTNDGKVDYVNEAIKYLATLKNEVTKKVYLAYLANETKIDIEDLQKELLKINKKARNTDYDALSYERIDMPEESSELKLSLKSKSIASSNKYLKLEKRMLEFAIVDKKYFERIIMNFDMETFKSEKIKNIFMDLIKYYSTYNEFRYEDSADYFAIDVIKGLKKIKDSMIPISLAEKELDKIIKDHIDLSVRDELNIAITTIGRLNVEKSKLDKDKDGEVLSQLNSEINVLKDKMTAFNNKRSSGK